QSDIFKYADDMLAGRWRLSFQGIAFDTSGRLIDGQHRLLAVLRSGMTIPFMVFRNVDMEIADSIDTGRKRSFADFSILEGRKLTGHHESTLRAMFPYITNKNRFTVPLLKELWALHSDAILWVMEQFGSPNGADCRGVKSAVIRGVVCRAYYSVDRT